ncbi:unnamed protein product [Polarella glacialis]|uniref:Myb-like domain-containing protein n=1 Tax=Polarella glacialis TaxID=89957 RepID=A0A813LY87_POLGL|nr:unnamed protein product [Polarella glacialis]
MPCGRAYHPLSHICGICGTCEPLVGAPGQWRAVSWKVEVGGRLELQNGRSKVAFVVSCTQLTRPKEASQIKEGTTLLARLAVCRCFSRRGLVDVSLETSACVGTSATNDEVMQSDIAVSTVIDQGSVEAADGKRRRAALLRLNRAVAQWSSCQSISERSSYVADLEAGFEAAAKEQNWRQLLAVLRQAAGALSPPRRKASATDRPEPLDEASRLRLVAAAGQQRRLRSLVLRAVEALGQFESDWRLSLVLGHISGLVGRFEQRAGDLGTAASVRQWTLIREAVAEAETSRATQRSTPLLPADGADDDMRAGARSDKKEEQEHRSAKNEEQEHLSAQSAAYTASCAQKKSVLRVWSELEREKLLRAVQVKSGNGTVVLDLRMRDWREIGLLMGRSGLAVKNKHRMLTNSRYAVPKTEVKHRRGVIKSMMKEAMARLGGKATATQIIHVCKTDAELRSKYSDQMLNHPSKRHGGLKEEPRWVISVADNMSAVFRATGTKQKAQMVYAQR